MSKKTHFRAPFHKQHGKQAETLFKAERQYLDHIYWSLWRKSMFGKSLCVICKILALFVNLLTADEKYSLLNRDYLSQHFQIQLSQKRKMLSEFFFAFSKSRLNFKHFQKKDDPHSWCIFELTDCEKRG